MKTAIITLLIILTITGCLIFWPIALAALSAFAIMIFYKSISLIMKPKPVRFVFIVLATGLLTLVFLRHRPNIMELSKQLLADSRVVVTDPAPIPPRQDTISNSPTAIATPAPTQNQTHIAEPPNPRKTSGPKRSLSKKDMRATPHIPTTQQVM
jgi:hypothetical protein